MKKKQRWDMSISVFGSDGYFRVSRAVLSARGMGAKVRTKLPQNLDHLWIPRKGFPKLSWNSL